MKIVVIGGTGLIGSHGGNAHRRRHGLVRLARAQYRGTRSITIAATPQEVWPWLVQIGCGRAGWYADDLLDNFTCPSARRIIGSCTANHAVSGGLGRGRSANAADRR